MSSPAATPSLVLIRRLADGEVEWIPLGAAPQRTPAAPEAAYTLIDRADYEAPPSLVAARRGEDLLVTVQGSEVLVLEGFFVTAGVAFHPTTDIAGGAGPFSGAALTAASPVLPGFPAGEQVVWSAEPGEREGAAAVGSSTVGNTGGSPLVWVGVAAGGLGLAALAGGGGGSGGGEGGGAGPAADTTAPQITSGGSAATINENSGPNQVVYTVTATDTGPVTYSLKADGDAAAFSINASTGAVTLTGSPDFETKSSYAFTVVATDAANNRAEQAVSLAIGNLDDAGPTITSGATAPTINENSGGGQVIYTVTATDTGPVTFSLKAGSDAASFSIDATTGAVRLTANPDHEMKSSYAFTVVAADTAGNRSEQAVTLAINDRDEVAPTITSGGTAPTIVESSGAGQVIYTVTSTDTGDISTGPISYSLGGVDEDFFSIDDNTGAVTLTGNPDFETKPSYAFSVVATDAAGNRSERAVSLAIADTDDPPGGGGDTTAPTLSSSSPADEEDDVPVGENIVLTFNETVRAGSGTITIQDDGDQRIIDVNDGSQVSISGNQVTINPAADLVPDDSYVVRIDSGAFTDAAGNPFPGLSGNMLDFRTANEEDDLQASSSDPSSRSFESVSFEVDIRDDSDDAILSSAGGGPGAWSGSAGLGSDDRIMFVANDADAQQPSDPANQVSVTEAAMASQGAVGSEAGSLPGMSFASVTAGNPAGPTPFDLTNMPAGMLTSQGLL